jgi:Membrane domain of glycerophosphoryl diester phosphodiesterase
MSTALRPMNTGELLDRAFEIYRKDLAVFAGIAALPAAVMFALHAADVAWFHLRSHFPARDQGSAFVVTVFLSFGYYQVAGFLYALFLPAFVRTASNAAFGESISILSSLRTLRTRWRSYLWLAILKYVAVITFPEALTFGIFIGMAFLAEKAGWLDSAPGPAAATIMLTVIPAGIFLFLWMGSCLALAFPAAIVEQLAGFKAMRRSWRLSRGSRMRILGVSVSIAIIGDLLVWAVYFLMLWAWRGVFGHWHLGVVGRNSLSIATYFAYAVIATFVAPLFPIAATLFYFDQRARKEGYDLERMIEAAGLEAGPAQLESAAPVWAKKSPEEDAPLSRWSRVSRERLD